MKWMTNALADMEWPPKTGLKAPASLIFRRRLYFCDDAVPCIIDYDIDLAKMLLDLDKCLVDLLDGSYVERKDKELRRGILFHVGCKYLRSSKSGNCTLVCPQHSVQQPSSDSLRGTGDCKCYKTKEFQRV